MTRVRARGEDVRRFIVGNVEKHPADISKITAEHFKITRQAVNKHLQKLTAEKVLSESGRTRNRSYKLCPLSEWSQLYYITPQLEEHVVWRNDIVPALGQMPENVLDIWNYGFTEMFNNAIDHSGGSTIFVRIIKTAATCDMSLSDNGVGIFKKIQTELNLLDERHAIFELSKGKLTTDPDNHTGEGIFFSSRMLDRFVILSSGTHFSHEFADQSDWIQEIEKPSTGTFVRMALNNHTSRTTKRILDSYTSGDDISFSKTVVPVKLARYGNEKLVSRSQAKRLLARIELFKTVLFDFSGVPIIGQAFADEIFRVFPLRHPEVELMTLHVSSEVKRMIERAKSGSAVYPTDTAQ